jgi:hypothetical protein
VPFGKLVESTLRELELRWAKTPDNKRMQPTALQI